MARASSSRTVAHAIALAALSTLSCNRPTTAAGEANRIRAVERQRLAALVAGDTTAAGPLHAMEFQLINPLGESLSRAQYLGGVSSGELDYQMWRPDSIAIHLYHDAAVIRYQSDLAIIVRGDTVPVGRYWHTDLYEKRRGEWQIVWSQATAID